MEDNNQNRGFRYTYSAREQEEVRRIREKYQPRPEESKIERLRRLDQRVTQKAQVLSLIFGVVGTLVLGFGMSLVMTDLGQILGTHAAFAPFLGILVGIVGGLLISLAYPVYQTVIKRERKKIAPEILRLSEELMK